MMGRYQVEVVTKKHKTLLLCACSNLKLLSAERQYISFINFLKNNFMIGTMHGQWNEQNTNNEGCVNKICYINF